jgi:hypothetical protein
MPPERQAETSRAVEDRRAMRRFDMRLPALVKLTGDGFQELLTETLNVSARGVFFYIDRAVSEGTKVELTLTLPSYVTLAESMRVRFTARVIRVENLLPASRIGVAALIEEYEYLPSMQSQEELPRVNSARASD